ncbi:MAG: amino acid adenylation domain-containing protein [Firmicutes bacterium]|nr:amino acid adenylation domain-containing protein [Bacillota bacterium]
MMIKELIEKYEVLDVQLWLEEEQLRYRAAEGILTKERLQELRDNKEELLEYLKEQREHQKFFADNENRYEKFPITDIQAAYLMGRNNSYESGGVGCHGYVELTMPIMDKERLEEAFHKVIQRHDMLRAVVLKNGFQKVLEEVELPELGFQDLRGLSKKKAEKAILEVREELSTKVYTPDQWPLYTFFLTTTDSKSILHCSIDMLVADFVSINIILKELDHLYYNPTQNLPELDLRYRDLVLFQREQKKHLAGVARRKKDEEYWDEIIDTLSGGPALSVNENFTKELTPQFEQYQFTLGEDKWMKICEIAKANNLTPSSVLLTLFSEVIEFFSKSPDFCINLTLLNRPDVHPRVNEVVGDFTSVNVLEISKIIEDTFVQRVKKLQKRLWTDLEHSSVSGVEVLRSWNRKNNTKAIIPIVYTSTLGIDDSKVKDGEFMRDASVSYRISQTPQVWIDCQVSESLNRLNVNWDVRSGVFPEGMVADAFSIFERILNKLLDEETWNYYNLTELPEKTKMIREKVNNTHKIIRQELLHEGFYNHVIKSPNEVALLCGDRKYTYKELYHRAITIQNLLIANGYKKKDIIAVIQPKGVWQIASILGILLAGCVYLPIDIHQPLARQKRILRDAGAACLLVDESVSDQFTGMAIKSINVNKIKMKEDLVIKPVDVDISQPAYVIYTSGTTGIPKGVIISHKAALNTIKDINEKFAVTEDDKILGLANISFDLSVYDIFGMFDVGGSLILPDQNKEKDPKHWVDLIKKYKITIWNSVPAMMQMLLAYMKSELKDQLFSMKVGLLSGDWIPVTLARDIKEYCPNIELISLGGATEAAIWSIYHRIKEEDFERKSIPYGRPLANQKFYVLNQRLQPCPNWVIGDLYIEGEGLAEGYLGNDKLTKEQFIIHPETEERLYKTGDLGRYLPNGEIEFMGREDHQVKIRGHRIELSEIENVLNNHPLVSSSVVVLSGSKPEEYRLASFIEADKEVALKDNLKNKEKVIEKCYQAGDKVLELVDRKLFARWVQLSDKTTLYEIMDAFVKVNLFTDCERVYSFDEIQSALNALPKFKRLIKRWLNALISTGFIEKLNNQELYRRRLMEFSEEIVTKYRKKFDEVEEELQYGKDLYEYMKNSSKYILELLRGDIDALELFFPEGKTDIAMAAYNENLINQSLNQVAQEGIRELVDQFSARNDGMPVRILEIGAGVGGTTVDLLPILDGYNLNYHFTDLSNYFLNEARNKFGDYSFVTYGLFDINKEYWKQGFMASSWDIIICANVLHNSLNAPNVLSRLKELLTPNGALIVIEATREAFSLLTSLEFKDGLTSFSDSRAGTERTFFSREEWEEMFSKINGKVVCVYPRDTDVFVQGGQSVFIVQLAAEKKFIYPQKIKEYLKTQLPEYMVPNRNEVLDQLPLTTNGKVDRKSLVKRVAAFNKENSHSEEDFKDELEIKIAKIWCQILNIEQIGRNENFYTAGGDSLLVAQVVSKMKDSLVEAKEWEWDRLMREMLQILTVKGMAEALRTKDLVVDDTDKKVENTSFLIEFKEGIWPNEVVKVLFHTGTGTLTQYNRLLPLLLSEAKDNEAIIGFCFGDEDEYLNRPTDTLVLDLAHKYATELLKGDYKRYELIGYCAGGWLALETARVLIEEGAGVAPVTVISTNPSNPLVDNDLLIERAFKNLVSADRLPKNGSEENILFKNAIKEILKKNNISKITIEDLCSLDGPYLKLGESFQELAKKTKEERIREIFASVRDSNGGDFEDNSKMLTIIYQLFLHNYRAMLAYEPQPFVGDVSLMLVKDDSFHFFSSSEESDEGLWKELVLGDLTIDYIEGNHKSCMEAENVSNVMKVLSRGVKNV